MKKNFFLIVFLFLMIFSTKGQNDTMYIMKNGVVIKKQSIKAIDIDSIIILPASTVTDGDGNIYKTVTIGTQIWMAENLKTTKYWIGNTIPLVTDNNEWNGSSTAAYCWYNNDEATYKNAYGAIYNWYAVNIGRLCPSGWHVPTDADWTTLTDYLGGEYVAGWSLKETGNEHWKGDNDNATNISGFTALPSGNRFDGNFSDGEPWGLSIWWSSTEYRSSITSAWVRKMDSSGEVKKYYTYGKDGYSVRCIKN